jgi:hypothetical protein
MPMQTTTPNTRTFTGGCLCGAVRYEVDLDLSQGTTRCNCTFCRKAGWWGTSVKPEAFRLLEGKEMLSDYTRSGAVHLVFCRRCGVRSFGHGDIPEIGGKYVGVSVNCLDGVELEGVPVRYLDGLHDTWATLAEAPYVDPFRPRPAETSPSA